MTAIPPLDAAAVPRAVRADGPAAVDRFRTALGFERVLLGELLETALPGPSGDAGPQPAQLHDTLADALVANGGIGLGASLCEALPANEPATGDGPPSGAGLAAAERAPTERPEPVA